MLYASGVVTILAAIVIGWVFAAVWAHRDRKVRRLRHGSSLPEVRDDDDKRIS